MGVSTGRLKRRVSDTPGFFREARNLDAFVEKRFSTLKGEIDISIDGVKRRAVFFTDDSPDKRVAKLACQLAIIVNRQIRLRVPLEPMVYGALLHDLGKFHEDVLPLIESLEDHDLRNPSEEARVDALRRLKLIQDTHTKKGPAMLERIAHGRPFLKEWQTFLAMVMTRHGFGYGKNFQDGVRWHREINIITLVDDFDAMTSTGPERRYSKEPRTVERAVEVLSQRAANEERYERRIFNLFLSLIKNKTKES
jgi:hypothetical protein